MTKPITKERVQELLERARLAADVQRLTDEVTDWILVADAVKHDWRCSHGEADTPMCLRCQVERLTAENATLREERDGWASVAAADTNTMRVLIKERDLYQSQRDEAIRERNAAASGQQEYGRVLDAVRDQLNDARGWLHTDRNVFDSFRDSTDERVRDGVTAHLPYLNAAIARAFKETM
jgi:hypothetical protein